MTQFTRAQKGAFVALGMALAATGASAAPKDLGRAAVLKAVVDCRAVADSAARLACYDSAAGRLDEAEAKGDVIVMDREQTRQARREAFGFSLPSLALLSRGETPEELDHVTFKVKRAWRFDQGQWAFELDSGAVWRQIETVALYKDPQPGSTVEIRSAALGSYLMNVDGQRAIRVKRDK